ncbi:MAG: hypothetical protein IJ334_06180 [Clostridia bacterium]|nr:hypothetical protein [Clostridia bacterium]
MKKRIFTLVLALLLILPAFTGCGNEPDIPTQTAETEETAPDTTLPASGTEEETIPEVITFDVPQTIDFGEFDYSDVNCVEIHNGITWEYVYLTSEDDIADILSTVRQITGENPVSSLGHYGCEYVILMYDTAAPDENTEAILSLNICGPSELLYGLYEIRNGRHHYPAIYTMTGISCEDVITVCRSYFPENQQK